MNTRLLLENELDRNLKKLALELETNKQSEQPKRMEISIEKLSYDENRAVKVLPLCS